MGPMLGLLGPIDYLLVYLEQSFVSLSKTIACYSLLFADYCVRNVLGLTSTGTISTFPCTLRTTRA